MVKWLTRAEMLQRWPSPAEGNPELEAFALKWIDPAVRKAVDQELEEIAADARRLFVSQANQ